MFQNGHRLIPQTWNALLYFRKIYIRIISKKPFDAYTDPILGVIRIFANIEVPWYVFFFKLEILFIFMANKIIPELQYFLLKFPARTNIRQRPKVFNSLNRNIQSAATFSLFNSRLKGFMLSWFSTCKCYSLLATFCPLSEQESKKGRPQKSGMHRPGIEPRSTAWKAAMLTTIPPTPVLSDVLCKTD